MEQSQKPKGKGIYIGNVYLHKTDLLRAISWLDFLGDESSSEEDVSVRDNLIKVINYLTRNG